MAIVFILCFLNGPRVCPPLIRISWYQHVNYFYPLWSYNLKLLEVLGKHTTFHPFIHCLIWLFSLSTFFSLNLDTQIKAPCEKHLLAGFSDTFLIVGFLVLGIQQLFLNNYWKLISEHNMIYSVVHNCPPMKMPTLFCFIHRLHTWRKVKCICMTQHS